MSNLFSIIDKFLDGLVPYYVYAIIVTHLIYILLFIGIVNLNADYLNILDTSIQFFVCLFLIIRFNPFRKHTFKPGDAHVIFGSATFLLLNLGFVKIFNQYFNFHNKVVDTVSTVINNK